MALTDLTHHIGQWLRGTGPLSEVVVSSRVRLARNLADGPFVARCSTARARQLEARLRDAILSAELSPKMFYVDLVSISALDRQLLVERHLISKHHAQAKHPRGLAVSSEESLAIMVNEEDHLRIQVFGSGLELDDIFAAVQKVDDQLESQLDFAFHQKYGYLTACPSNVGTGLRVSCMLHLPALKMTGEIDKVVRAAHELRLEVRGLYGEGSEASGDLFQVSNQVTLGASEAQILQQFRDNTIGEIITYEQKAREALMSHQRLALEDKVYRALGLLRSCRMASSDETMYLLSLVRLGIHLGIVRDVELKTVNELFLLTQPAHLQKMLKTDLSADQRAVARAEYIRRRLGG